MADKDFGFYTSVVWDINYYNAVVGKNLTSEDYQYAIEHDGLNFFSRRDGAEFFYTEDIIEALEAARSYPFAINYVDLTEEEKLKVIDFVKEQVENGTIARNYPNKSPDDYSEKGFEEWKKVLLEEGVYVYDFDKLNEALREHADGVTERYGNIDFNNEDKTPFESIKDYYKNVGIFMTDERTAENVINYLGLKRDECVSMVEINDVSQEMKIDYNQEIMTDDKANVILLVYDDTLKEFYNRIGGETLYGMSFEKLLDDTDATISVSADILPDKTTTILMLIESEDLGWKDYKIPVTPTEAKALFEEFDKLSLEHFGISADEFLVKIDNGETPLTKLNLSVLPDLADNCL